MNKVRPPVENDCVVRKERTVKTIPFVNKLNIISSREIC